MNTVDVQHALIALGWPITADGNFGPQTHEAVKDFQRGWGFYPLLVDGQAGPQTQHALEQALANGGHCSEFFRFSEFKSKGNGWIKVDGQLVVGLDVYRRRYGPTSVISGYRDPIQNRKVGGASNSQHLYGNACDVKPVASINAVRNLHQFSGIGFVHATGLVAHVDVRHVGPNTTGGTPTNPTIWQYY